MIKRFFVSFFILIFSLARGQCPQLYNSLGNLSASPQFISCTGTAYALNVVSNSSWGAYTVGWGDGTSNSTGSSYAANSSTTITHTYAVATATYGLILTIPALNC